MDGKSIKTRKKEIQVLFKIREIWLKGKDKVIEEIISFVHDNYEEEERDSVTEIIVDKLVKENLYDIDNVRRVLNSFSDQPEEPSPISFINVFDINQYRYDPVRENFYIVRPSSSPNGQTALFKDRYLLLSQQYFRHRESLSTIFTSLEHNEISRIGSLVVGCRGKIIGLTQLKDGHLYLEDTTDSVQIDMSDSKNDVGFFLENNAVVAEGILLQNRVFKVSNCGLPPFEKRKKSMKSFSTNDFFGAGVVSEKERELMEQKMKVRATEDFFVVLSDIFLDKPETYQMIEKVLDRSLELKRIPYLFVFMGDFSSKPAGLTDNFYSTLRSQFGKLGKIIASREKLIKTSRFLFISGPQDTGLTILPRCSLPKFLVDELLEFIPGAEFASNPCRVKFYSEEIVFFREDLLGRMRDACLFQLNLQNIDPFEHLVATITHQRHLCPLPLSIQPIIWDYDHTLHLYPAPHTIFLGDRSPHKALEYKELAYFNTGSFSNDGSYAVYHPLSRKAEFLFA